MPEYIIFCQIDSTATQGLDIFIRMTLMNAYVYPF